MFAAGGLGVPVAPFLAGRFTGAVGLGPAILVATVVGALARLALPAAPTGSPLPFLIPGWCVLEVSTVLDNVNQVRSARRSRRPG